MAESRSFWTYQLRTTWHNLGDRSLPARVKAFVASFLQMLSRHHSASGSPLVGSAIEDDEKLTVIVLNHKRPQNVGQIAQYVLRAGFVARLIISNNSQAYPIEDYVKQRDPRLVLLNQDKPAGVGIGFEIARDYPARYYVRIDDDIFLHPAQLQWIYWNLRHYPESPHGIFGAVRSPENPDAAWPFVHKRNTDGPVEILNGLFAFTREHLEEYFRLCRLLGIEDQNTFMNGEDIVLSVSGTEKPRIHNVGPIWECASEAGAGVALHQSRPKFHEERIKILNALAQISEFSRG